MTSPATAPPELNAKAKTSDNLPPHSVPAEEAVLGSILINPAALHEVDSFLKSEDFFIVRNQWVWEAMVHLAANGEEIDNLTVAERLRDQGHLDEVGGVLYITYLIMHTPSSIYTEMYGRIVQRAAFRRRMLETASKVAKLAHKTSDDINSVVEQVQNEFFELMALRTESQSAGAMQIASESYDRVEAAYIAHQLGQTIGLTTGIRELDDLIGGLLRDKFYVLAGRPGMGKTALLLTIMWVLLKLGVPVGLFSLEMDRAEVAMRFAAMETGISVHKLEKGKLTEAEFALFTEANARIALWPFWVNHTPAISILSLRSQARSWYMEHGIKLVLVDYLQLATGDQNTDNRTREVGDISRGLKQCSRELHLPVMAAAQLNRNVENRQDKRPGLADLRESGDVEQDADAVMFLYRDDYYNPNTQQPNMTECHVAKQRNGPTGTAEMYFRRELTQFSDLKKQTVNLSQYGDTESNALPKAAAKTRTRRDTDAAR